MMRNRRFLSQSDFRNAFTLTIAKRVGFLAQEPLHYRGSSITLGCEILSSGLAFNDTLREQQPFLDQIM